MGFCVEEQSDEEIPEHAEQLCMPFRAKDCLPLPVDRKHSRLTYPGRFEATATFMGLALSFLRRSRSRAGETTTRGLSLAPARRCEARSREQQAIGKKG